MLEAEVQALRTKLVEARKAVAAASWALGLPTYVEHAMAATDDYARGYDNAINDVRNRIRQLAPDVKPCSTYDAARKAAGL